MEIVDIALEGMELKLLSLKQFGLKDDRGPLNKAIYIIYCITMKLLAWL